MIEKVAVLWSLGVAPKSANALCAELKKPLKTIYRVLKEQERNGFIAKIGYPAIYDLMGEGRAFLAKKQKNSQNTFSRIPLFPQGVKNEKLVNLPFKGLRLHAFSVKFPLIGERAAQSSWWDKQEAMRGGWVKCWKFLLDKGVKVECSHLSVILHFESKFVRLSFRDFDSVRFQRLAVAADVQKYLKLRGVDFDLSKGVVIRQHGASQLDGALKGEVRPGVTEELLLGRGAVGVWPAEFEARAWLDSSQGPEFEANDDLYWRKWLLVPETVDKVGKDLPVLNDLIKKYMLSIKLYDAQIEKHLEVMQGIGAYFELLKKREEKKE